MESAGRRRVNNRMSHDLYIVTGMHRTGTSLVAHMLEVYGISLPGELVEAAPDNEKGFFEDKAFVALNDELLDFMGLNWSSLSGFGLTEGDFNSPRFNHLKSKASALLEERHAAGVSWAFKDPRVARLWPFWAKLLDKQGINTRLVIPFRAPAEVVGSLAKRNEFNSLKSQCLYFQYYYEIISASASLPTLFLDYHRVLAEPRQALHDLAGFFGNPMLDEQVVDNFAGEFVSDDLQHNASYQVDEEVAATANLYRVLSEHVQPDGMTDDYFRESFGRLAEDMVSAAFLHQLARGAELDNRQEVERLNARIATDEEEIGKFRAYQERLEANLAEQRQWSDKLTKDVTQLKESVEGLQPFVGKYENERQKAVLLESERTKLAENVASLSSDVSALQDNVAGLNSQLRETSDERDSVREKFQQARQELKDETNRLWAVIEKYRMEGEALAGDIELIKNSTSWKVTAPLRWVIITVREAPRNLWFGTRNALKRLVMLLPEDSVLRRRIFHLIERMQMAMRGEIDNRAIRESHRDIIAGRQQVIGAKPALEENALPRLHLSVVTYNSSQWIDGFVSSLASQDYPLSLISIAFVDNGSSDDTATRLEEAIEKLPGLASAQVIHSENVGFGRGHNQGVAASDTELVLVTNIDLEFRPDALVRAVSFAVQDDDNVACWELRQAPFEHPKFYDPVTLQASWCAHAAVLMRRTAFESVGGYEPRIFMYGEDVELSYRFRTAGLKLRYLPFAVVNHYTYEEAGEVKPLQFQGSTLANAYLRLRYGSWVDAAAVLPMYVKLIAADTGVPDSKEMMQGNARKVLGNASYFLRQRRRGPALPFRGWDYDIAREGAFYEGPALPDNDLPVVSVVTRTYRGRAALLRECIQSVAHQSYPNIEHVIVEDGGDTLRTEVDAMKARYPAANIRYFPLEKLGRCHAGNAGLERTSGDYLVFLDDDDLFFGDHLETLMAELLANESLVAAYALAWEVETDFLDDGGYEELTHGIPHVLRQPFDREVLAHHNYIPIQSIVFKRELFEAQGGFDPELDNLEDWNLWIRYASMGDFKFIRKTTSMYRTPWDLDEKERRQRILDAYLPSAREKNEAFLASLDEDDSTVSGEEVA